jgi:hypothetical protein
MERTCFRSQNWSEFGESTMKVSNRPKISPVLDPSIRKSKLIEQVYYRNYDREHPLTVLNNWFTSCLSPLL